MAVLFEPVLLRLKEQLSVSTDKEVAALLGLGEKAFNARKKRGAFPEDKLLALVAKRPDLNLDVAYILTGDRAVVHAVMGAVRAAADIVERLGGTKAERKARSDALMSSVVQASRGAISEEEQLVLGRYRAASQAVRDDVLRILLSGIDTPPAANKIKTQINVGTNHGQTAKKITNKKP